MIKQMLTWQAIGVFGLAILLGFGFSGAVGISALLGGLAVMIGAFFGAVISQRARAKASASEVLGSVLKGEGVKIITIIILLLGIFKMYKQLVPIALIAGLAVAALFSGIAIAKTKDE